MAEGSELTTARREASAGARSRRSWQLSVDPEPERPDFSLVRRLILGSALMLFLELALIRWLGSNVVHLSTSRTSCCSAPFSVSDSAS